MAAYSLGNTSNTLLDQPSHTMLGQPTPQRPDHDALQRLPLPLPPPPSPAPLGDEVATACWGSEPSLPSAPAVGGRYVLEQAIGEGGMGKIFRARHQQLGKSFALKVIHDQVLTNPRARAAFFREARLASSLDHPGIVSTVDFGEDPHVGTFMVMELVDGAPLSERLTGGKALPVTLSCDVLLQLAEALHYIHSHGIVHCDIKPTNVLLCKVPSASSRRKWRAKLLDFGIARPSATATRSTQSLEGTPAYLAPERIHGQAPRCSMDVYSLGVLAYEMLTGSLPFNGSIAHVLYAHCEVAPESVSARRGEPVDERLEQLVMKALEKDPSRRHKDMAAFIYELRTVMDMMGVGPRRRRRTESGSMGHVRAVPGVEVGYQTSPVPMAGLQPNGTVIVANRAFAKFLTGDADAVVTGHDLCETALANHFPGLLCELQNVHRDGQTRQFLLELPRDGTTVQIAVWLVAGLQGAGEVHLTVHAIAA